MDKNEYALTVKANFDISDVLKGLNNIQNAADNSIKNIAKTVMDDLSSVCTIAVNQIANVVKENLMVDLTGLNSAFEGTGAVIYEKFRDPLHETIKKAVQYITELNQSISNGKLSESVSSIATMFGELSSEIIRITGNNVIPALITGIGKIADNFNTLKGVIILATAEFLTFKTAAALKPVIDIIKNINTEVSSLASETQVALVKQLAFIGGMTQTEIETAMYTKKLTFASAATAALNSETFKLTATTAGIGAFVGAAAWLINYAATADTAYNRIKALNESVEESKRTAEDSIEASEIEIKVLKNKADQYEELRKKENRTVGEEERLKNLAEELQQYMPEGTKLINEQTGAYNSLEESIEGVIESMQRRAKMSAYEELYTDLVKQQLEAEKNIEKAQNEYLASSKSFGNFGAGLTFPFSIFSNVAAKGVLDETLKTYYDISDDIEILNKKIFDLYEDASESGEISLGIDENIGKSPAQLSNEEYVRRREKEIQDSIKKQEENTQKMQDKWSKLNHQYAIGEIKSDEELYEKKLEVWNKFGNKYNKDHWQYYEELYRYEQDAAEKHKQDIENAYKEAAEAQKQAIQDKWDSISKQESLGLISSEEAYKQQLALIEKYCPEYADEWYSYYAEILDYQRDALREQVQGVRDSISDIVSEYQTEFSKIEDSISSYKNRLLSVEPVFTIKTETDDEGNDTTTYTVENMTKQMEKMQKYHNFVKNLKDRGVSSEVLSELTTFDFDDGMVFAENLAKSSDEELEKISALYAERDKLAEDLANELYAPEMNRLNEELFVDITAQFGTLPAEIRAIGNASLNSFAEGLLENKENLAEAAQEFISSFFEACDEGISSGSVGMENVGENIAAMLGEQDTYSIGYESGSSFAEGLSDALGNAEGLFSRLMSGHADVSASLVTAGQADTVNYGASSWSGSSGGSGKTEKIILENKEEVTVKIDREVLGKTVMEWTKEYQRGTGT